MLDGLFENELLCNMNLRREKIMKAFGLVREPAAGSIVADSVKCQESADSMQSASSDYDWLMDEFEDDVPANPKLQPEQHLSFVEHMDECIGKPVRLYSDGSSQQCVELLPGADGFLWATWLDGSKTKTEMPSLLRNVGVMKRPSSQTPNSAPNESDADDEQESDYEQKHPLPVLKKPAVKPKYVKKLCSEIQFEFPADRYEQFPNGCAKCKKKPGCTKSCWIYRLKLNK